jgi:hypothetical protein
MGAYDADWVEALDQWVDHGNAPQQVLGHRLPPMTGPPPNGPPPNGPPPNGPPPGMDAPSAATRPICAYPNVAHYNGTGPVDAAQNFSCRAAGRGVRAGDGPLKLVEPIS